MSILLSLVFDIKACSDIDLVELYNTDYTGVFYTLYANAYRINDKTYLKSIENNSVLDAFGFQCCRDEVKIKIKQHETDVTKKQKAIKEIEKLLKEDDFKTKYEKRHKYNLINKLYRLKKNLGKDISFGGKKYQREVTKLKQELNALNFKIDNLKYNSEKELKTLENERVTKLKLIEQNLTEFRTRRRLGLYVTGQANQYGNRKFNLDLNNNCVVFKPESGIKIDIKFDVSGKKRIKVLSQLQFMSKNKLMPISIRLTKTTIIFMYDEAILNGFKINKKDLKAEQKDVKDDVVRKQIYKKYAEELDQRRVINKIYYRYCSIDINPKYIGVCIFDYVNGEFRLIKTMLFDLSELSVKLGVSSSHPKQIKQNNKRKHEITEAWSQIFDLCMHYRVFGFVVEDLEFKNKECRVKGNKEFNKQTKNIWHRTLTTELIEKNCNELGLKLIAVIAAYSSFIGNLINVSYVDPIAAAIEIGRRGATKFLTGNSIYPCMKLINQEKLLSLLGENDKTTWNDWKQLYTILSRKRYRNTLSLDSVLTDKFLGNAKSKVRVVTQRVLTRK